VLKKADLRPIGIFDSGVGGLTVLKAALAVLPNESYIYIGDTKFLPYGTKSPQLVKELAADVARTLLKQNVKALVVACNTISAVALAEIQSLAKEIPVIGVIEPTVRFTLQISKTSSLGVIATETTIASGIYEQKINEIGKGKYRVISKAAPAFVPLIEEMPKNHPLISDAITLYLQSFKNNPHIKTLILGCTHYPMIKTQIEVFLGKRFSVVDSAQPTAHALRDLLKSKDIFGGQSSPTRIFFTSDDPSGAIRIAEQFMGGEITLEKITIARINNY
jgi:glutamate racemase